MIVATFQFIEFLINKYWWLDTTWFATGLKKQVFEQLYLFNQKLIAKLPTLLKLANPRVFRFPQSTKSFLYRLLKEDSFSS